MFNCLIAENGLAAYQDCFGWAVHYDLNPPDHGTEDYGPHAATKEREQDAEPDRLVAVADHKDTRAQKGEDKANKHQANQPGSVGQDQLVWRIAEYLHSNAVKELGGIKPALRRVSPTEVFLNKRREA